MASSHQNQNQNQNRHDDQQHNNNKDMYKTHKPTLSTTSSSSSPSHEFSFTISLHHHHHHHTSSTKSPKPGFQSSHAASSSFDLSPADDIFFHGHLLPLHFLSAAAAAVVSPRSSTNSLDSFTLPIADFAPQSEFSPTPENSTTQPPPPSSTANSLKPTKLPKPFSLFNKWKKKEDSKTNENINININHNHNNTKKLKFDVSQVLKRYMRMFFGGRRTRDRAENHNLRRQPYSFSGVLSPRNEDINNNNNSNNNSHSDLSRLRRKRPGEYSAPASMRTSPTNSGLLVATASAAAATTDSTMEELQAAIQAAIAHCKNSIAGNDDNSFKKL